MAIESVLIVDDDEADHYLIERLLHKSNISSRVTVFRAYNGREAFDFLSNYEKDFKLYPGKFPYLLILLDINMPIMNGLEFLNELRELQKVGIEYDSCKIIMLSSSRNKDDKERSLSYDFVAGYIEKMPDCFQKALEELCH